MLLSDREIRTLRKWRGVYAHRLRSTIVLGSIAITEAIVGVQIVAGTVAQGRQAGVTAFDVLTVRFAGQLEPLAAYELLCPLHTAMMAFLGALFVGTFLGLIRFTDLPRYRLTEKLLTALRECDELDLPDLDTKKSRRRQPGSTLDS
jgi:hypothetical protein